MTLLEVLESVAATSSDATSATAADGSTLWTARGQLFAAVAADGRSASFLLDPIVAAAAARTPDVSGSTRGPGWVDLHPVTVDGHVADRAGAWFVSGYRRLTGAGA